MNKTEFLNTLTRNAHKAGFMLKKHSPEILMVTGIVTGVASVIAACKASMKVQGVLEETKANVDYIHDGVKKGEVKGYNEDGEVDIIPYSAEDGKKDLTYVYAKTGLKLAKMYGPAVALGTASIGCVLMSHNSIHKRNLALTAAYTTVEQGFKEYRERVVERFGEKLDKELKYNIKAEEVERVVTHEDGTEEVVKETIEVADPNPCSDYGFCFCEGCTGWEKNAELNLFFVKQTQNWATDKLRAQGYLFLNDVRKMFGLPPTQAGQIVGWVYDKDNPIGDNYVDFGIYDLKNPEKRAFVNGWERSIWIDPNVDGDIFKLMK